MRYLGYLCCVVFVLAVVLIGCGKEEGDYSQISPEPVIAQKTCPVMGGDIDKSVFVIADGRKIYFCCPACVETFKKDPEKYIAKVDAELKKAK